jgi:hypothetical protein
MDTTDAITASLAEVHLADPNEPRLLNFLRLKQLEAAVHFLQYYHNAGGASNSLISEPLTRGRCALFRLLRGRGSSSGGWEGSMVVDAMGPEGDEAYLEEERYGGVVRLDEQHIYKEIWLQLRKTWAEGMSVTQALHKLWVVFVDACRKYNNYVEWRKLEDLPTAWDALASGEQEAFCIEYFSVGPDVFAEWFADIDNRQAEDPSVRQTPEYATAMRTFRATYGLPFSEIVMTHNIWPYEFGGLGAELRHWRDFKDEFRQYVWQQFDEKFEQARAKRSEDGNDVTWYENGGVLVSKEDLKDVVDCSICYRDFFEVDDIDPDAGLVQPVKISCGHMFCTSCYDSLVENRDSDLKCPMCRKVVIDLTPDDDDDHVWSTLVDRRLDNGEYDNIEHLAEQVIQWFDQYIAGLPADVVDDAKFSLLDGSLDILGTHVFGPTEQLPQLTVPGGKFSPLVKRESLRYHLGVAGLLTMRNRLEAYLHGDTEKYRRELKQEMQLTALAVAMDLFNVTESLPDLDAFFRADHAELTSRQAFLSEFENLAESPFADEP